MSTERLPMRTFVKRILVRAGCSVPVARVISWSTGGRVPSHGIRIDLGHPSVPDRIRAAVFWRLYERAEVRLIQRHLPPHVDVIEIGASLGVTAAHAASKLDDSVRLVAVEANPLLLPALNQALAGTGACVVHAAVSTNDGDTTEFFVDPKHHLWSRLRPRPGSVRVEVPMRTLSSLVDEHVGGPYSLIADVEGAEAAILLADAGSLERCVCMIIELHDTVFAGRPVSRDQMRLLIEAEGLQMVSESRRTMVFRRG